VTAILEEQAPSDLEKISSLGVEEETEAPVAVEDEGPPDLRETPPLGVEDETKVHFTVEDEESQTGPDRRQYARFTVGGRTKGRVTASSDALVLDISLGGAKIEHAQVVRPGTLSFLDLELQGKKVRLRCRVIRSVVHRAEVQPDGERELVYHTGLQFIDPSDELRQLIGDYIQSVIKDS
ncbi:MAG: PilZ domain-containing protein, partial [Candidatus Methylomirabilales bacterium]